MARYMAKFTKGYGIKFISHLDLMRSIQRAIRRAEIPISYSKGFNPHAEISFATPLSVGTASNGDYLDFNLDTALDEDIIVQKVNSMLPEGLKLMWVKRVDDKFPSLMSIVAGALYEITIVNISEQKFKTSGIVDFVAKESIEVTKSGKKGNRVIDIQPMIHGLELKSYENEALVFSTIVDAGSKSNLNPELIVEAMRMNIPGLEEAEIRDITKLETYTEKDGQLITPVELL